MVFRLMYRKSHTAELSIDTVHVESFKELFADARSRAMMDVCSMCTIVPHDRMEALASVAALSTGDMVRAT